MNKVRLYWLSILVVLLVSSVSASQIYYATSTKYRGEFYGKDGFPCADDCWVHDCAWISARVNVPKASYYTVRMPLKRDGYEQSNENIGVEVNGQVDYQRDDGSYTSYHNFGPFYFQAGYNEILFSSTSYGDFLYRGREEDCYYGSVHFNEITLLGCPDTDDDGICDDYDYCIGENQHNLPYDTACRNWFLNEVGCHDYTNKAYGYVVNEIDCDYLNTECRDYRDSADICDSNGNVIYGNCNDYTNRPSGTVCGSFYYEYDCYFGTFPGSDVYRREHRFYCDSSGSCKESITDWELYQECSENEICYVDPSFNVICKSMGEENFCPQLEEIDDMVAEEGDLIVLDINATDLNGDNLVFTYSGPFDSQGEWQISSQDSGNYTIELTVSDGECEDSWLFNLEVLDDVEEQETDRLCFPEFYNNDNMIIKSVEVNGIDVYDDIDEKLSVERGQDLFIKVRFEPKINISELLIETYIDIDDDYDDINISDKTAWFDVIKGTTYTRELILNVPDDLDKGDYLVKIIFYDEDGRMDTCAYKFKVALPIYSVVIKELDITPRITKAGRAIIADVELKNIGNNTVEGIDIEVTIPQFNIKDTEEIGELEPRETRLVKDFVLRIPACEKSGDYYVKAVAEYEYEKVSRIEMFEIIEGEGCSESSDEVDILKVNPEAENIKQGDVEIPYTVTITNPDEKRKTFFLDVEGVDLFGEYRLEPSNVIIVPGKTSQVSYLYVKADISDVTGPKTVVVSAKSDTLEQESVIANIIQAEKESCWTRFCKYIKSTNWYSVLLLFLIIIISLILIFFLLKSDKDEKEKKF